MADIAFGIVGGAIGSLYGNTQLGLSLGMMLGGLLFPPSAGEVQNGKSDVKIQTSSYGSAIPLIYGSDRIAGTITWGTDPREVVERSGGGKGKPKIKNYKYFVSFSIHVCVGPIYKVTRIWANSKVIYENTGGTGYAAASPVVDHGTGAKWAKFLDKDNIRIYLGSYSQPRDPVQEADLGTANCPADRGTARIVFEDFPITPFGNSIPNIEVEVQTSENEIPLSFMLEDLCERCQIESSLVDFSELDDIIVDGCTINSRTEARNIFEAAQKAYLFDICEYDSKIRGHKAKDKTTLSFDSDILGAGIQSPREEQYELSRQQEVEIPRQLNVLYRSQALDYQTFAQNATRVSGSLDEPESLQLPFVISEIEAKKIALIHVHLRDQRRTTYVIHYPLCGIKYSPGDVILVNLKDIGPTRLKIVENYLDFFGVIQSICVEEDQRIYTQTADPTSVDYPGGSIEDGEDTRFRIIDTGPIIDEYSDEPTILYAASGPGSPWPGGTTKVTGKIRASSGKWVSATSELAVKSTIGEVVDPIPVSDPSNVLQDIDIYVNLFTGNLFSATDSELLEGENVAAWGNELIQWKTATFISGTLWKLNGIYRARRGTEWAMDHVDGEQFVVIDDSTTRAFSAHRTEWNVERTHVLYEDNRSYSDDVPESITYTIEANSAKALSPVHITFERDGSENISIEWIRRDRKGFDWVDGGDIPMSESELGFEVEVWDSSYSTLKRTINTSVESATYSSVNQISDFGSNQSIIYVRIYQIQPDKPWQRGHAAEVQG